MVLFSSVSLMTDAISISVQDMGGDGDDGDDDDGGSECFCSFSVMVLFPSLVLTPVALGALAVFSSIDVRN
jgi:hypothetical protein